MPIRKAMMAALARNQVIGRDNQMPWHLPEDLRYFKQVTMSKPIIMGRKTFESIGRALPGRLNIVVTRRGDWPCPAGAMRVGSVDEAFNRAIAQAEMDDVAEVVVIGGGQLYAEALDRVDRLYLTWVQAEVEGDTYFPALDWNQWREIAREDHRSSGTNPFDYSFVVYDRRPAPA